MAAADTHTPNVNLAKIGADRKNWSSAMNNNITMIDALFGTYFNISNLQGPWVNSTAYAVGNVVVDSDIGSLWLCRVANTSSAAPTTFAQERTTYPSYWSLVEISPTYRGAWTTATFYQNNDFVLLSSAYYVCRTSHTSGVFATDLAAGKWELLIDMSTVSALIAPNVAYIKALITRPTLVIMLGGVSYNDGNGGFFVWMTGDTTPPDDQDSIQPTAGEAGRYLRFNFAINI